MYVKCHGKTVFKKIDSLHHHVCQSESKYKESKKKKASSTGYFYIVPL